MNNIDFSKYSIIELVEAKNSIDKELFPENYEALMRECNSRNIEAELKKHNVINEEKELQLAKSRVKVIGVFQALAAIVIFIYLLLALKSDTQVGILGIVLALFFVIINALAGFTAFKEMHQWYWVSVINQFMQVLSVSIGSVVFNYSGIGGIYLAFKFGSDFNIGLNANIEPGFSFYLLNERLTFTSISVDILAVVFVVAFLTVERSTNNQSQQGK